MSMGEIQDYSNVIADKLLQGWKLLDEQCPVTGSVPLLRDKDGRKWSAALNQYVDSPMIGNQQHGVPQASKPKSPSAIPSTAASGQPASSGHAWQSGIESLNTAQIQADRQAPLQQSQSPVMPTRVAPGITASFQQPYQGEPISSQAVQSRGASRFPPAPQAASPIATLPTSNSAAEPDLGATATAVVARDNSDKADQQRIVTRAIEALYQKIDAARRLLVSTRDVTQSRAAAQLITECSTAIKTLSELAN